MGFFSTLSEEKQVLIKAAPGEALPKFESDRRSRKKTEL